MKRIIFQHYNLILLIFKTEMKLSKNRKITTGFLNEMSSSARVYHNSNSHSIMDLLPYLTQILQMNIRPVIFRPFFYLSIFWFNL